MDIFQGLTDIATTLDGDFVVENNDLKRNEGLDWFIQEVNKIIKSSNDWYFAPNAGAGLDDYYGQPNTREIGRSIETKIMDKIKRQGIHFPAKLIVKVVPLSLEEIKLYINLDYHGFMIEVSKTILNLQNGFLKSLEEDVIKELTQVPSKHPYSSKVI